MIILKDGVKAQSVKQEIVLALMVIAGICEEHDIDLVVTSIRDGVHSHNSKHKLGYAVDIRSREISDGYKVEFTQRIRDALTDEYYVKLEDDHIHIQFNGGFL